MLVLDHIQDSLARALHDAAEHERTLVEAEAAAADRGALAAAERQYLDVVEERLRGLLTHLAAAERVAAGVDSLLAEDERAARDWSDMAAAARRRLAGAGTAGIS
jgi:hypothetical protein